MQCITVIATIKAKADQVEFVRKALCRLVTPTRNQWGNFYYGFYQNREDPSLFHSFENWNSEKAIEKHLKSAVIQRYFEETKDAVEDFKIEYFYKIC